MQENKLKVLLCAPYGGVVGGIAKWTGHITSFYKQNLDTKIDLQLHNMRRQNAVYANTPKLKRIFSGVFEYYKKIKSYKQKISSDKVDVVHITSSASLGLFRDIIMLNYAKKYKVKSIVHFRFGRIPDLYKQNNWEKKLLDKVIHKADKVVVIDELSYFTLINEGFDNVECLPNPLTPEIESIIQENKDIKRKDRTLLFAGHLIETKGIFELIKACKEIPNIQLKMVGAVSNEVKNQLIELAGNDYEKWLIIANELDFKEVIKEMLSANIFVLPTYTEGFPNVIIESMACACPIVTTSVGAIPEMLDIKGSNDCGICVEPKNIVQLKEGIEKMLNNPEYAILCGINAQQRVNDLYTMPKVWNSLEKIWQSMILKEQKV